ncbi:MAG: lysoplasmalogenase [Steroidobacteraceae bacterium]
MTGPGPYIVLCTLAVAALLAAERRQSQRGKWLAKPLASLAFVATAFASGGLDSSYGLLVLCGLASCLLGDVLLIPEGQPGVFRAGIVAFLCGHLLFAAAFLTQPLGITWLALAGTALAVSLWFVWRWLRPTLPADMRVAVLAYLLVIGAMASLAVALAGAGGPVSVALGALAFAASDVSVARDRFVREEFFNRAWGLPLYYFAQLLIALSTAAYA